VRRAGGSPCAHSDPGSTTLRACLEATCNCCHASVAGLGDGRLEGGPTSVRLTTACWGPSRPLGGRGGWGGTGAAEQRGAGPGR
jgi:hypothetical protein